VLVFQLQVGQVVATVDVDGVELEIAGADAVFPEPFVQHQVILLDVGGLLAPDDQDLFPLAIVGMGRVRGHPAFDLAEPPGTAFVLPYAAVHHQLGVLVFGEFRVRDARKCRLEGLWRGCVQHAQADQEVEGLDQIDRAGDVLVGPRLLDVQGISGRIGKGINVEERLAAPCLHIQHVAERVVFPECRVGGYDFRALRIGIEAQVIERVLVGFQADVLETVGNAGIAGRRFAVFPIGSIDDLGDTGFEHRIEIVGHFNEDVFSFTVVFAVEVDNGFPVVPDPAK